MITAKEKLEILSLPEDSPSSRDRAFEIFYNYIYSILKSRNTVSAYTQRFQFTFLADQILRILKEQNSRKLVEEFGILIVNHLDEIEKDLENFRKGQSVTENIWKSLQRVEENLDEIYPQIVEDHKRTASLNQLVPVLESQKDQITQLIQESIELIKADNKLSEKQKQEIISYLKKALRKLDEKNTAAVFGVLKETVIIIGVIGPTLGGATIFLPQTLIDV